MVKLQSDDIIYLFTTSFVLEHHQWKRCQYYKSPIFSRFYLAERKRMTVFDYSYFQYFFESSVTFWGIIEIQMNLFDELGGITPRTEGGLNRQPDAKDHIEIIDHVHSENGLDEEGMASSKKEDIPTGWTRFIKLAYYAQYFQISEKDIIQRITYSITIPHQDEFIITSQANPDFYGPFWILTTLIMLLGFAGNFSNYLLSKFSSGQVWDKYFFKLEFMREAIILVYTFGLGVPIAIYFMLKVNAEKLELELPNLICLYGYSLFCFIPAIILCILPLGFLHWICLLCGLANSFLFLRANLLKHANGVSQVILQSVIGGMQFIFILCLKFIFLQLIDS